MDAELLSRAKIQDFEREVRRIRMAAAATGSRRGSRPAPREPETRTVTVLPLRLLRRACRQAGALRPAS
jgi:hypothetical protein